MFLLYNMYEKLSFLFNSIKIVDKKKLNINYYKNKIYKFDW